MNKKEFIYKINNFMTVQNNKVVFNDEVITEADKNLLFNAGFEIDGFYYETLREFFYNLTEQFQNDYENETLKDFINYSQDLTIGNIEPDIYTRDLLKWTMSINAYDYVDSVISEGSVNNYFDLLSKAQRRHKDEVYKIGYDLVKSWL